VTDTVLAVEQLIIVGFMAWFGFNLALGGLLALVYWHRRDRRPSEPTKWEPLRDEDLLEEKFLAGRIPAQRYFRRLDEQQAAEVEERR
jgi:hypothetical protein